MKTRKSAAIAVILSAVGVAGLALAQAQETANASTDSIVAIAADSQSLPQVAPANVPIRGGTFWFVYPGEIAVPAPCLSDDPGAPIWGITSQEFLVDMTGGSVLVTPRQLVQQAQTTNAYAAAVTAQVQDLIGLITWIQNPPPPATNNTVPMSKFVKSPLSGKGGISAKDSPQSGYPYLKIAPTGTNQLLITVINTNSATYYLQMTPVLANTNYPFAIIVNGALGQTNFTVNIGPFTDEFFRALMATNNPGQGIAVFIDSPANGATVQ